jgi:hypothetical protein
MMLPATIRRPMEAIRQHSASWLWPQSFVMTHNWNLKYVINVTHGRPSGVYHRS